MFMTRDETIEQLTAAGIPFDADASDEVLAATLEAATPPAPPAPPAPEEEEEEVPPGPPAPPTPLLAEVIPELDGEEETFEEDFDGITVKDPEILRPQELPLVITPPVSGWKNDAQARYAQTLNGYAYKNPRKWKKKKAALIKRLIEIGKDPEAITFYEGNEGNLSYTNRVITPA